MAGAQTAAAASCQASAQLIYNTELDLLTAFVVLILSEIFFNLIIWPKKMARWNVKSAKSPSEESSLHFYWAKL